MWDLGEISNFILAHEIPQNCKGNEIGNKCPRIFSDFLNNFGTLNLYKDSTEAGSTASCVYNGLFRVHGLFLNLWLCFERSAFFKAWLNAGVKENISIFLYTSQTLYKTDADFVLLAIGASSRIWVRVHHPSSTCQIQSAEYKTTSHIHFTHSIFSRVYFVACWIEGDEEKWEKAFNFGWKIPVSRSIQWAVFEK